ncbi:type II secretion system secretin GspD [Noviherbaspirillum cavernae]|nr:type II secretion system secretin GspD [Noviherbaspirillum cavernae]
MCAVAGAQPAFAQDPATNQATLNFVGADIESVVKAIGHYTRTTFIIDPRVKGTINLVSEKPVNKEQAFQMLTSALRLQGFAVVRSDGYTKVVPEADAKLQAGPPSATDVRGDQIATQIFRLNYENAANLVPVLRPLISPNNTINANPGNNSIVITDYADNLKRMARIIASLDSPASAELDVVPIRYAVASDIAAMVNRMMESGPAAAGAAADAGRISLLADSRTNSVLVRAPSLARANLAKSLVAKLDQPTAQPGNVHVVYLRNADAVRLAQTLRAVVAAESTSTQQGTTPQPTQPQSALQQNQGQQGSTLGGGTMSQTSTQTPAALPAGGAGGFIQADPATNTLIITASEAVYRNLRAVIDQLDSRRAQVYVESLIVEVAAAKAAEFGIQWLGLSGNDSSAYRVGGGQVFSTGGNNLIAQLISRRSSTPTLLPPGNGLTLGIFRQINGDLTLGALARALETDAGANILSVPNLITLDNEEARIIVGQNVPFITGQYTTAASAGAAGVNPFQTIERRDVGLALRVRPQISEGGTIKLQIYQETSNVTDTSNPAGIITSKRSIESNVLVDDGNVIVLGGLIEDRLTDNEEKVPGLGDLPVLGGLFKYQTRKREKTNLLVFLRPTVIRTAEQSAGVVADRYDYIRGVQINQQPARNVMLPDPDVPVIPPLLDGRPTGGPMLNLPPRNPGGVQPIPPATVPAPMQIPEQNRQQ